MGEGIAGRWEVNEDGYEEQIIIPKEQRDLAAKEGINTENKQKVAVRILNLKTGESYTGRLAITGNHQTRLPLRGQASLQAYMTHVRKRCRQVNCDWYGTSGQVYLPTEIQKMLEGAVRIRIQLL